jgi:hypothetical protein
MNEQTDIARAASRAVMAKFGELDIALPDTNTPLSPAHQQIIVDVILATYREHGFDIPEALAANLTRQLLDTLAQVGTGKMFEATVPGMLQCLIDSRQELDVVRKGLHGLSRESLKRPERLAAVGRITGLAMGADMMLEQAGALLQRWFVDERVSRDPDPDEETAPHHERPTEPAPEATA